MILLLLFFLPFPGVNSDPVVVEALVHCDKSIDRWWGELSIYEDDWGADDLFRVENFTTTEFSKLFMYKPFYPDDPGLTYEFAYQLKHNCTKTGKILCLQPKEVSVSRFGLQRVNFLVRAFENGVEKCPELHFEPGESKWFF